MIEVTDEMVAAAHAATCGADSIDCIRDGLAAVLAIVERDQKRPAAILMDAAAVARGIADRLAAKPGEGKVWIAMSAGARMVAVRLVELADDADGNGYAS